MKQLKKKTASFADHVNYIDSNQIKKESSQDKQFFAGIKPTVGFSEKVIEVNSLENSRNRGNPYTDDIMPNRSSLKSMGSSFGNKRDKSIGSTTNE